MSARLDLKWCLMLLVGAAALALSGCIPSAFPAPAAMATPTPTLGPAVSATESANVVSSGSGTATLAAEAASPIAAPATSPPTSLPMPTETRPATATATTTRASASPLASASRPPTPGATPTIPVAPVFAPALHDYTRLLMGHGPVNRLGSALAIAQKTEVSRQRFGPYALNLGACGSTDSQMLWRQDTRQIYFMLIGNTGLHFDACPDTWEVFADTWQPGDLNNDDIVAPAGKVVPRGGFGQLWRTRFRSETPGLGFPAQPESYTSATVQRFEHGTAFYFHDTGQVYVLFDDFCYQTRSGIVTGRVWFQAG